MGNLTKTSWPAGWTPSADAINGDSSGLLRMDNLRNDKKGVIGLIDGQTRIASGFADYVSNLYTKIINGQEIFWWSLGNIASQVYRSGPTFTNPTSLLTIGQGSPTAQCCFGDALGNVIAIAGNLRTKDSGLSAPVPLGLQSPIPSNKNVTPLTGVVNNQQTLSIACPTKAIEGTSSGTTILTNDPTTLEGQLATSPIAVLDTTKIGGTTSASPNSDLVSFLFSIQNQSTSVISGVQLTFVLDGDPTDPSTWQNYYSLFFDNDYITAGFDQQFTLSSPRGAWVRYGTDQTKNWTNVIGVVFLFKATDTCTVGFSDIKITGGSQGSLNGTYNYIQVNESNNGTYVALSPPSAPAINSTGNGPQPIDFTVINGSVTLTPAINDANVTGVRFYRISSSDLGVDPATGQSLNPSSLGQYYFVGRIPIAAHFSFVGFSYLSLTILHVSAHW